MMGRIHPFLQTVQVDLIWKHYIKFYLFKCKLRECLPRFAYLKSELELVFGAQNMANEFGRLTSINVLYD